MQFLNIIVLLVLPVVAINFLQAFMALGLVSRGGLRPVYQGAIYGAWTFLNCTAVYLFMISQVTYLILRSPPIADPTWMLELLTITLPFNIIMAGKIWLVGRAQHAVLRTWMQRLAVLGAALLLASGLVRMVK